MSARVAAVSVVLAVVAAAAGVNTRPIVGIMAQPYDSTRNYIAASYVKWVESAGARAVPLMYDAWDRARLREVLQSVNGVLLPGGAALFVGVYRQALETMYEYAIEANSQGVHFPIWGTCLGVCRTCC